MADQEQTYRKYNTQTNVYNTSQTAPRAKLLNGYVATNIGDTTVRVNGKILFPSTTPATVQGDAFSVGGNEGEIYVGDALDISFAVPSGPAPAVEIVQKFYIDNKTND